jgi:predicted transcriptional regulator
VDEIKQLAGTISQHALGRRFCVTQSCISNILRGKRRTPSSHAGRGLHG